MAWTAGFFGVLRHHRAQRLDAGRQAKASLVTLECFTHSFDRWRGETAAVVLIVFMALLSFRGISTPSLQAQGEQRRPSFFNIERDISDISRIVHHSSFPIAPGSLRPKPLLGPAIYPTQRSSLT